MPEAVEDLAGIRHARGDHADLAVGGRIARGIERLNITRKRLAIREMRGGDIVAAAWVKPARRTEVSARSQFGKGCKIDRGIGDQSPREGRHGCREDASKG